MRRMMLMLATVLASPGCAELERGNYRLEISGESFWYRNDALYKVGRHGELKGRIAGATTRCAGELSVADHLRLTELLNHADVLNLHNIYPIETCVDNPTWTFTVVGLRGSVAGMANQFEYEQCDDDPTEVPALDDAIALIEDRLGVLWANGACNISPVR